MIRSEHMKSCLAAQIRLPLTTHPFFHFTLPLTSSGSSAFGSVVQFQEYF